MDFFLTRNSFSTVKSVYNFFSLAKWEQALSLVTGLFLGKLAPDLSVFGVLY